MSGGKARPGSAASELEDQLLQAVVLADSFNRRFRPLTLSRPKALLPLVNQPLIEYTLELLAVSGVHEVIVFCCYGAEQLRAYLSTSAWARPESPFAVQVVEAKDSMSVGDAMRDLDARSLIKRDFILLNADVVSNLDLEPVLRKHITRRQRDKNTLMTMVLRTMQPGHRSRPAGEEACMVVDPATSQLLQYQRMGRARRVAIGLDALKEHSVLSFRNDFADCRIDICSPEVPALFTENFDWQDIRDDFVRGVLESDILSHKIYTHVVREGYAARVQSLRTYDAVSKDIITRWTFPLVPDANLFNGRAYAFGRNNVYKDIDVVLARSCRVLGNTVLGEGTVVGVDTFVRSAVLGRHCKIGDRVTLEDAYLWDNVTIGEGCSVKSAVLGDGVVLLSGTTVSPGCIVADNVTLGPDVTLPPMTRVAAVVQPRGAGKADPLVVGAGSNANVWARPLVEEDGDDDDDDDNDDDDGGTTADWSAEHASFGSARAAAPPAPIDANDDESSDDSTADLENADEQSDEDVDDATRFHNEARQTVARALGEKHTVDNAVLELNGLKFAYNASFRDCYTAALEALLESVDPAASIVEALKKLMMPWGGALLKKFVRTTADQVDAIHVIQRICAEHAHLHKAFSPTLQVLYHTDVDVLQDDALVQWDGDAAYWASAGAVEQQLHVQAQRFIAFVREQMDDDDDDDDKDEE